MRVRQNFFLDLVGIVAPLVVANEEVDIISPFLCYIGWFQSFPVVFGGSPITDFLRHLS